MDIDLWTVGTLLAFAAIGWFWFDSLKARERAMIDAPRACEREGLQFLDDTVECISLRIARNEDGQLRLRRIYRFEFSDTGDNRRAGQVVILGDEVLSLTLDPYLLR